VEKEIVDLEKKIREFREGRLNEEKFRSLRLARGVYGQCQTGVQMVRIKLPFGRLTAKQLARIADVADEYSNGNLHLTTRQDIQIHYVSLDKTPGLCDFYLGSIVRKGDLKIAISTNGKSPTFAKRMREYLEEAIPDNVQQLMNNLNALRNKLKGNFSDKVKMLNELTSSLLLNVKNNNE